MAVGIIAVYIVVVVFPIAGACVVGRINIDTIYLARIEVRKKLKRMVIVSFYYFVPQRRIRRGGDFVYWLKIRINWVAKISKRQQFVYSDMIRSLGINSGIRR